MDVPLRTRWTAEPAPPATGLPDAAGVPGDARAMAAPAALPQNAVPAEPRTDVFAGLYARHFPYVVRTLRRLGAREADLADLAHDVFVVVHRKLASFDPSRPEKPWLYGIAFRVALDRRRKAFSSRELLVEHPERAWQMADAPGAPPTPLRALEIAEANRVLHNALATLDFDQRAVFVLVALEGLSVPEVAAIIQAPLNTLYSRLRLARAAIAKAIATPPTRFQVRP